jgi:hypothetical protein
MKHRAPVFVLLLGCLALTAGCDSSDDKPPEKKPDPVNPAPGNGNVSDANPGPEKTSPGPEKSPPLDQATVTAQCKLMECMGVKTTPAECPELLAEEIQVYATCGGQELGNAFVALLKCEAGAATCSNGKLEMPEEACQKEGDAFWKLFDPVAEKCGEDAKGEAGGGQNGGGEGASDKGASQPGQ